MNLGSNFISRRKATSLLAAATIAISTNAAVAQSDKTVPLLTIAIASVSTNYGALWVALADDYFGKNGVKVEVINFNAVSTGTAMLASGQIDLFISNAYAPLRIAQQGKPVSNIFDLAKIDATLWSILAKPGIDSMAQLQAAGTSCRLGDLAAGTGTHAYLLGVIKAYNLKCATAVMAMSPLMASGVTSGQLDAAPVTGLEGSVVEDAGKGKLILDPVKMTREQAKAIYPYEHSNTSVFGLKGNLQGKRESVTRFVRALIQANEATQKLSPEEVAAKFANVSGALIGNTPMPALVKQWRIAMTLLPSGPRAGFISEESWKSLLAVAPEYWAFPPTAPADPQLQYGAAVDMSYFEAALKR